MGNVTKMYNKPEPRKIVLDMIPGQIAYVVPWAIDDNENLSLNASIADKPSGTVNVRVMYNSPQNYTVWYPKEDGTY